MLPGPAIVLEHDSSVWYPLFVLDNVSGVSHWREKLEIKQNTTQRLDISPTTVGRRNNCLFVVYEIRRFFPIYRTCITGCVARKCNC